MRFPLHTAGSPCDVPAGAEHPDLHCPEVEHVKADSARGQEGQEVEEGIEVILLLFYSMYMFPWFVATQLCKQVVLLYHPQFLNYHVFKLANFI